ncbi:hypothetical protein CPB86DRAFT_477325 [Serendipita vermifera]|nr:hypothetical protein CPB86DRAFT_477325 [Serendipita vermifera]
MLIKPLISSYTNLYIEMDLVKTEALALNWYRGEDTSSFWVDGDRTSHILNHGACSTEIVLGLYQEPNAISKLPAFIDCLFIRSIYLGGGEPLTAHELGTFPNLTHFEFIIEISCFKTYKRALSDTLNSELPISCPNLNFIGLYIRSFFLVPISHVDGAESAIENFLEGWLDIHGKVFGTIRVEDGTKPSRWKEKIPLLEMMLNSFELGDCDGLSKSTEIPPNAQVHRPE